VALFIFKKPKKIALKFVVISDTHCRHHNLKLPEGDVLLHAGDISYKGHKEEIVDFLKWFSKQDFAYKIFIAGNHDFYLEKAMLPEIESLIPQNVIYLNDSGLTIDGINIWGSPITPWFFNWAFNRHRGDDIKIHWDLIPANTDILITHGPVLGIHDTVINSQHVGCRDLLEKVKEIKPKVHICGHVHEGYGITQKFGTKFINACILNESYELVNKPVLFTLP
jgi:Icc-related predicted phosphoesterase